jgi:hypothetical protein
MFQVVQRKVDIPIVERVSCQAKLKDALNIKKPGVGDKFTLSPSEVSKLEDVGIRIKAHVDGGAWVGGIRPVKVQ